MREAGWFGIAEHRVCGASHLFFFFFFLLDPSLQEEVRDELFLQH